MQAFWLAAATGKTRTGVRVYLDHNATSPLRPQARAAMVAALDLVGNASSVHSEGRQARAALAASRESVAAWLGVGARQVVFSSGATEAANLALTPSLSDGGPPLTRLLVAATEHPCVLDGHRFGSAVTVLPVDRDGRLDLAALDRELDAGEGRALLALQIANNETGAIQPVAEAAARVHARNGLVFCDAVQAASRLPIRLRDWGADLAIVSAHKFGGPKGAGALAFVHDGFHIESGLVRGGRQELGFRAGTENVTAIVGLAAAVAAWGAGEVERITALRDRLEAEVLAIAADAVVFSAAGPRLGNTCAFAVPGLSAETLLMRFDLDGIAVSSGSACSSGKVGPSHVLAAMGVAPDLARGAVRVSLGWSSTEQDVARFGAALGTTLEALRTRRFAA